MDYRMLPIDIVSMGAAAMHGLNYVLFLLELGYSFIRALLRKVLQ
jgi:hypothetical protein